MREFSLLCKQSVEKVLKNFYPKMENFILSGTRQSGEPYVFSYGEVLSHIMIHEVHHMGQLSVWARQIGLIPVNSDFIK
ncbi:DinB family protein [Gottfriedia sp. NPDC056225]|uniref:DinB family protein n=1 Tax=Gottfriedia sp. NPDC056225 TaxID=3345751 RepID=UPI0035DABF65